VLASRIRILLLLPALLVGACGNASSGEIPAPATVESVMTLDMASLPVLPKGWPTSVQLGMSDGAGGASSLVRSAPFGFRYQYLAGGVNTGSGWAGWEPDGSFVSSYVTESAANKLTPVFTYYMLYQSKPGVGQPEPAGIRTNLENVATMTAYFNDVKLLFTRLSSAPSPAIVHVEPDLWGHMQTRGSPASIAAKVAATGLPELKGLSDNAAGFAQAFVKLRDLYAPNVLLTYHLSRWGSGEDPLFTKPNDTHIDALASRSARFYEALHARFDLAFTEFSDRDSGFKQVVDKDGGASWWKPADFDRHRRFLRAFAQMTDLRIVLWQIPFGNTKMRALNNTWNHFQDNKVEWLLDESGEAHIKAYVEAGVIAFLFGRGADGATCACDAAKDGTTDPAPFNGNEAMSLGADDDGGFFRKKAQDYYSRGPVQLRN
jgi:hypothetical protein